MRSYPRQTNANSERVMVRKPSSGVSDIKTSWHRCDQVHHLDSYQLPSIDRVSGLELKEEKERITEYLIDAMPLIDKLRITAQSSGYCVLVTNDKGVVVERYLDSNVAKELCGENLGNGSIWLESIAGTNGVGTCLENRRPLTVFAGDHFSNSFKHLTCSAAPLIGPDREIFGVLDVSSFAKGNKRLQGFALNTVCETANKVETLLFKKKYSPEYLIFALLSEQSRSCSESNSLVAVDYEGVVCAATTSALSIFNVNQEHKIIGFSISSLFGIEINEVLSGNVKPVRCHGSPNGYGLWLANVLPKDESKARNTKRKPLSVDNSKINTELMKCAGKDEKLVQKASICLRTINRKINILLHGETGTGKEVWAKAIHKSSDRKDKPFITLNCASIPESLIESELFGYTSGTFTGGLKGGKVGKILASDGGTLFLDEIGDMPIALQARLLRVIAESEITPLGQNEPVKVKLHVICATHRDLKELISTGEFREDLYYRISGVNIELPAFRERSDKIEIINSLVAKIQISDGFKQEFTLSQSVIRTLCDYHWPGNIRQLKSALQYAMCVCEGSEIDLDDLPEELLLKQAPKTNELTPALSLNVDHSNLSSSEAFEVNKILETLAENRWIVTRAAKVLNISRSTLHRKLKKYNLLADE
ncbi:sigma-54-dependent Fis family transcriptional regulator [Enterovibrio sp. ZSDZ35]|uniref:Sigma-54-dependent Fis family transcriptional regulator n=1 Tax=Enterovibrio qingdaonensis TaxID=2899818 RepID=A0ABT5QH48_9GAMM|nr:sigma-54-dependent Fis family transcriptional regulator [Enterovibrio sp. ZSDZ35]MDD1780293.1 sigma-54-dependent Fis family transcriptional regulator [Enterovibrio sp. ZSDZ35]